MKNNRKKFIFKARIKIHISNEYIPNWKQA